MSKFSVPLTNVIAERLLSVFESEENINISVYNPQPVKGGSPWSCPYKIEYMGTEIINFSVGADSLQSIQLVGGAIKATIKKEFLNIKINDDLEVWFPNYIPYYQNSEFNAHINKIIETELEIWVKQMEQKHRSDLA